MCLFSGHSLTTPGNTAKDYFTPGVQHRRHRWVTCWLHLLLSLNLNCYIANMSPKMYNHNSKRVLQRTGDNHNDHWTMTILSSNYYHQCINCMYIIYINLQISYILPILCHLQYILINLLKKLYLVMLSQYLNA